MKFVVGSAIAAFAEAAPVGCGSMKGADSEKIMLVFIYIITKCGVLYAYTNIPLVLPAPALVLDESHQWMGCVDGEDLQLL